MIAVCMASFSHPTQLVGVAASAPSFISLIKQHLPPGDLAKQSLTRWLSVPLGPYLAVIRTYERAIRIIAISFV